MGRWAARSTLPTLALAAAIVAATVLSAAAAPVGPQRLAFTRNVLPGLANAVDLGAAPAEGLMRLAVSLARPDTAGEQVLLDAVHNPADRRFHQFLPVDQFAARFGVPAARADAAAAWLSAGGLHVAAVSTARDLLSVDGSPAAVGALFRTPIHAFQVAGHRFLANTGAPTVPLALGISNIVGLNTLQRMAVPRRAVTGAGPHTSAGAPAQGTCLGATCVGGTTPADLTSVYQAPARWTGQGQRIAIFGSGRTDGVISDLRAYQRRFGLPALPVAVKHPVGEANSTDDEGHLEWDMDTQAAHAMAPGLAGMSLYFGSDLSDPSVVRVFSSYTDDPDAPLQASASYGECESVPVASEILGIPLLSPNPPPSAGQGLGNMIDATLDGLTRQAALEGRTIFAASGDTGSSCPVAFAPVVGAGNGALNQGVPVTNSPASLPAVVAVGGTVLYTDGAGHRSREYAWPYSGGGSTLLTPAPSYQQGNPGVTAPCASSPTVLCRGIPDVAAQSGDATGNGFDIVGKGQYLEGAGGGTSLSAPLWAGLWARVQSAAPPGGLGFANYALYRSAEDAASYRRDFFDVTVTDLSSGLPTTNGIYPATPGWDYVTGLGAPRVAGLICDLARRC